MSTASLLRMALAAALLLGICSSLGVSAQEDLAQQAVQLSERSAELFKAGRALEGVAVAEQALAIYEKLLDPESASFADALKTVGILCRAAGAYANAQVHLERAVRITEKLAGPNHPRTAKLLNEVVGVYLDAGAFIKAQSAGQRALTINEEELAPEHSEIAVSLTQLALAHALAGEYAKAESLYRRALAINEKVLGPEHATTAITLNNFGELYRAMGAYSQAEQVQQRAFAIRTKVFGPQHPTTATSINNLALVYTDMGEYAKAEPLHAQALAIVEASLGPEHPSTAAACNNLGELYRLTGAYQKAEPLLLRALTIREKLFGADHPETLVAVNNLAELYSTTGADGKAEPLYVRALASNEKTLGADHPTTTTSLNNLGALYMALGKLDQAAPLLERALAIRERTLGAENVSTADSLANLAALHATSGAYQKAVPLLRRAVAINEKALGATHPRVAAMLDSLADVHRSAGDPTSAEPLDVRVQEIYEDNTLRFLFSGSESRQREYLQQATARVSEAVARSLSNGSPRNRALGLTGVLQYKGRVLDAMSDSVARLRRNAAPADRALFDQLSGVAQELSSLVYGAPAKSSEQAYRERFDALTARQEALQAQLSARSAAFRETVTPVTLEAVRRALPEDAVLVEWVRFGSPATGRAVAKAGSSPRYMAYVLQHSGDPIAVDAGEAAPLDALMTRFRDALMDPATDSRGASRTGTARADLSALTVELSAKLVKPLRPHLRRGSRLLISPDGALNLIPFAALVDEQGEYLAQHHEISYLTSGRDLLRITTGSRARSGPVVLAAPSYGDAGRTRDWHTSSVRSADLDRSSLVFNALPGTAAEAQALQSLMQLDPQHVLMGERATEAQLRALQGPRILHLATHGFFLEDAALTATATGVLAAAPAATLGENPLLRSGLALAGANERRSGGSDDGILTAAEVAQLDLLGTQLVVLSACETALGRVDAGEGVYGLRRALVLAGAHSQLVSLWKVDDSATQQLMSEYYRRLLAGEGRAAALRGVQREMLASPERRHPYYWAAFIPVGSWTALSE